MEVSNTLRGISRHLRTVSRTLSDTGDIVNAKRTLDLCKANLLRLHGTIDNTNFNNIMSFVDALLQAVESTDSPPLNDSHHYFAERLKTGGKGRPKLDVSRQQLELLVEKGFSTKMIASALKCSKSWVYKILKKEGLNARSRYTNMTDISLREHVANLHREFPNSGEKMMRSYLRADGIRVQRRRVRSALELADPVGTAGRWGSSVSRRSYSVPGPNSLWHIDGHMKLIRWGLVTHAGIDGFSRLIPYLSCSSTNKATAVVDLFMVGARKFGLPSRVRSDYGGENVLVALLMNLIRGTERGSHITGRSVHNCRIERLWYDVFKQVIQFFYHKFYEMEDNGHLDVENDIHIYALHFVYLDLINEKLGKFQKAWNSHELRTAHSKTPEQMWLAGMLNNYGSNKTFSNEIFHETRSIEMRLQAELQNNLLTPDGSVGRTERDGICISEIQRVELLQILEGLPDPLDKYLKCIEKVAQYLSP
ncbi:uncharacterized protein [Apostichopus japonicus]|uniref:uncharacterized protein n=1 Tax=Stichopus japonicus TaxID=307972 RepID=UPI003AB24366